MGTGQSIADLKLPVPPPLPPIPCPAASLSALKTTKRDDLFPECNCRNHHSWEKQEACPRSPALTTPHPRAVCPTRMPRERAYNHSPAVNHTMDLGMDVLK